MKPSQKEISLNELFKEQYGNKLDDAVNEVLLVEEGKPDENWPVLIEIDSTMTRVSTQVKTKALKRWVYLVLASGGAGLAIQRIVCWASEQFGK